MKADFMILFPMFPKLDMWRKKKDLEMKTTASEIKNTLKGINYKSEVKEQTCELKGISV